MLSSRLRFRNPQRIMVQWGGRTALDLIHLLLSEKHGKKEEKSKVRKHDIRPASGNSDRWHKISGGER